MGGTTTPPLPPDLIYVWKMACKRTLKFRKPMRIPRMPRRTQWRCMRVRKDILVERVRTHYQIVRTVNEDGSLIRERVRITPETWWEDVSESMVVPTTPNILE